MFALPRVEGDMSLWKTGNRTLLSFAAGLGQAGAAHAAATAVEAVDATVGVNPAPVTVAILALRGAIVIALPVGMLLGIGGYLLAFARLSGRRVGAALIAIGSGMWLANAFCLLLALFPAS